MLLVIVAAVSLLIQLALATTVLLKNNKVLTNRAFFFLSLALMAWASLTFAFDVFPAFAQTVEVVRWTMFFVILQNLFFVLFAYSLIGKPLRFRWPVRLYLVLTIVVGIMFVATPFMFSGLGVNSQGTHYPIGQPGMLLFVIHAFISIFLGFRYLMRKIRHSRGQEKSQLLYILMGSLVLWGIVPITNFVLSVSLQTTFFASYSPLYVLAFSSLIAYAMIKHHLFDIRLLVARLIAYLLLLVCFGGLYGFGIVALSFFLTGMQLTLTQVLSSTLIVGMLILFVQPLKSFFNRLTKAIFYQDAYDTKDILDRLAEVLVRSTDTLVLAKESVAILQSALKSEYVVMLLNDSGKNGQKLIELTESKNTHLGEIKYQELANIPDILSSDSLEGSKSKLYAKLHKADIAIIARLETQGEVTGYCIFGYKTSGSAYNNRDIDLIRIACDELAVAIQNSMRFDQIQEFNETLKARIEEATKELRASNTQLQRLDEAKDEFVSMASHQLRTPLTSVKGYISMVLEGDAGKITATQRRLLGEAYTSSERMVHLINDFLNVSRLQTGKFMLEQRPVDLCKVVEQEVESLQTTAKAHDLALKFRKPSYFPILYIDEGKLRQVLMNFIDNAIYYSHEGTTIDVKLEVIEGDVVLTVHDTGIGVPKAEQAHLFSKFFRATNARKQRPDGTGVGLFLAKKIVDAHGGSMVFESVEGEGSTFGFRLPIKKLSSAPKDNPDELNK